MHTIERLRFRRQQLQLQRVSLSWFGVQSNKHLTILARASNFSLEQRLLQPSTFAQVYQHNHPDNVPQFPVSQMTSELFPKGEVKKEAH